MSNPAGSNTHQALVIGLGRSPFSAVQVSNVEVEGRSRSNYLASSKIPKRHSKEPLPY